MDTTGVFGIGSTNFRYAAATTDGKIRTDISVEPTRPHQLPTQLSQAITKLQRATGQTLDAVSISTTGLVDETSGVIRNFDTPAGDTIEEIDVRSTIQLDHQLPVSLANDCNASALGEWHFGARTDHSSIVHVTFGTGIGGGIVEDGRLVRGENTQSGEFGLFPLAPEIGLESTGVRGAWEAYCSGRGIPRFAASLADSADLQIDGHGEDDGLAARARSGDLDADAVFQARAAGDPFAEMCLDRVARLNAAGIATICNTVNPGLITLGGGVALNNPDWIRSGIDSYLDEFLFVDRPTIRITPLGDDIGLYGAVARAPERGPIGGPTDEPQTAHSRLD